MLRAGAAGPARLACLRVRILHVGWGFRPWRSGGLIAYVEDVIRSQAARGHDVAYFFAGRHLPSRAPHLRRWRRDGARMYELWNSPITVGQGTLRPDLELSEPRAEAAFERVLDTVAPDVIHVQELLGLPSSLLELPRRRGIPVVVSLEDYQILCPTVKLYDADGNNCKRLEPGEMCRVCSAYAPPDTSWLVRRTVQQTLLPGGERATMAVNNALNAVRWDPRLRGVLDRLRPLPEAPAADGDRPRPEAPVSAAAYDHRRDVNVERLRGVDRILAMSHGVAGVCRALGVDGDNLHVLHFTLDHIARIAPDPRVAPGDPLVFTVLNACASVEKGVEVVLGALERLAERGLSERFRLDVWGFVEPRARDALESHAAVRLRGNYTDVDLERMLAGADVGIVPSVWEEAYAYTGVELLAAGLPVIGSALGGIPDYVVPGETGWLNRSVSGAELAEHMERLIGAPGEVEALRRRLRERRPAAVKPMERHLDELEAVYAELIGS
jgi:glycosyltransferase involved in cell wall biosynthesis